MQGELRYCAGTLTAFIACFCSLQVPSKNPQHFILLLKTPEALEYVFLALLGHGAIAIWLDMTRNGTFIEQGQVILAARKGKGASFG